MKRSIRFSIYSFIIVFVGIVFYFGLKLSPKYSTKNLIGFTIPIFSTETLNDSSIYFSNQNIKSGKYSLINIWASWCSTCRIEHKFLMKLSKVSTLDIYGVNFKDEKKNAISYLNEFGNPYLMTGLDYDGSLSINLGIYGVPESVLIDKNKKILAKYIGPLNKKYYREIIYKIQD